MDLTAEEHDLAKQVASSHVVRFLYVLPDCHPKVRVRMHSSSTIRLSGLAIASKETQAVTSPVAFFPTNDASDECLMVRISEGNRESLAVLFRRYSRLVRGVALRILRDDSEADDLLQELFLFVHRKASIFDSQKSSLRSWIVQMTYQRAIDRRRYLQSRHFYTHLELGGAADLAGDRKSVV